MKYDTSLENLCTAEQTLTSEFVLENYLRA